MVFRHLNGVCYSVDPTVLFFAIHRNDTAELRESAANTAFAHFW